ncbi:MAG: response regulator [Acetobacteraceae bacterium]|nr:response regulator [Acetobacteraceae bacterium]
MVAVGVVATTTAKQQNQYHDDQNGTHNVTFPDVADRSGGADGICRCFVIIRAAHGPEKLLAEDSPDNRTIALAYLEDTPYQIDIAENGAIACEKFMVEHYDLVLMDRQMPVMDGLAATRTMRTWERENGRPPTPIIALTASALKGDKEKCLAAGCTAYLSKPIKQEALRQAIREYSMSANPSFRKKNSRQTSVLARAKSGSSDRTPAFLRNCRQNVIAIGEALDHGDFATVEYLGHGMRGAGGMFGFQTITDIGAAIELAGESSDTIASRKSVDDLSNYLDLVQVIPGPATPPIIADAV